MTDESDVDYPFYFSLFVLMSTAKSITIFQDLLNMTLLEWFLDVRMRLSIMKCSLKLLKGRQTDEYIM